ncbi:MULTISPECIES: hypothetical protein [unclassified Streptomyces]|uniref:hypothetical protein n=1 Tax=unclassified Streptomyces TaxID=2593676 RepID=UPI00344CD7F8
MRVSAMQTILSLIVLVALVAVGVLFLARVNAQTAGRPTPHHYAHMKESLHERLHKHAHGDRQETHPTGPPPPPREPDEHR